MRPKTFLFFFILILCAACAVNAEDAKPVAAPTANQTSDQQIGDFSLAGYGERGKKTWDLAGKSADIFTDTVKLDKVTGNLYGKEDNIKLTADKGDFNKQDGKVHLEKDVVITTTSGTKLTTNSLDWDRKNEQVSTKDAVNIQRSNVVINADGAHGEPNLKKVALEKNVRLDILPEEKTDAKPSGIKDKIIITCDGPLEVDYEKNVATFKNNVKVEKEDSIIYSDTMDIYFLTASKDKESDKSSAKISGSKIDKIVARGNVKVVRGDNVSYSQEATYSATDKMLILSGRPKLIISTTEGLTK